MVYGAGVSRKLLLVLARQHNDCHFAEEGNTNDGEYMPHVPRYNSNQYREYKQECHGLFLQLTSGM